MDRVSESGIGPGGTLPRRTKQRKARREAHAQADGRVRYRDCLVHAECRTTGAQCVILLT
jgi:hypothetical protein